MERVSEFQRRLAEENPELLRLLEIAAQHMKWKCEKEEFVEAWLRVNKENA